MWRGPIIIVVWGGGLGSECGGCHVKVVAADEHGVGGVVGVIVVGVVLE